MTLVKQYSLIIIDILLINPKHKELIEKLEINKDFNEYKKISIITKLKKGDTLYIPTNWYYIILVNKLSFTLNDFVIKYKKEEHIHVKNNGDLYVVLLFFKFPRM